MNWNPDKVCTPLPEGSVRKPNPFIVETDGHESMTEEDYLDLLRSSCKRIVREIDTRAVLEISTLREQPGVAWLVLSYRVLPRNNADGETRICYQNCLFQIAEFQEQPLGDVIQLLSEKANMLYQGCRRHDEQTEYEIADEPTVKKHVERRIAACIGRLINGTHEQALQENEARA